MVYVSNAFSLGMLTQSTAQLIVREVNVDDVKEIMSDNFTSAVGHNSTASVISTLVGKVVEPNRINIKLEAGDVLLVFQLLKRLEEGQVLSQDEIMNLPHKWYVVEVK